MDDSFKLDEAEHNEIFAEIEELLFEASKPAAQPQIVIVGGQPGSGKTRMLEQAGDGFEGDANRFVMVNGDEMRFYHPQANEILELDDKLFSDRTDPDSRGWTIRLFERAIETRRNIVFETTMRDTHGLAKTLQNLQEQGYRIAIKVIACSKAASTTGVYMRYETQKSRKKYGRFTPLSVHDAGYVGLPETVRYIEESKLADSIAVFSRNGKLLYNNELTSGHWCHPISGFEAIEQERNKPATEVEREKFNTDWQTILDLMERRNSPKPDISKAKEVRRELEALLQAEKQPVVEIVLAGSDGKTETITKDSSIEDLLITRNRAQLGKVRLTNDQRQAIEAWIEEKREKRPKPDKDRGRKRQPPL